MGSADVKHVAINRENMTFIGASMTSEGACLLANLAPECSSVIMPLDLKSRMSQFGVLELLLLIKNTTGEAFGPGIIHDYPKLLAKAYELALEVPLDQRSLFELQKLDAKLPPVPEPKLPFPHVPVIIRMGAATAANYTPPVAGPKVPKAPTAPGVKPAKGSTGKVWDIADRVMAETGLVIGNKQLRTAIIEACKLEGINEGTAATQYGKWKATK